MVFEYEFNEDTQTMRVNCLGSVYGASIEDSDMVMARIIDNLRELRKVARIVMVEAREYEYDFSESRMLLEIALAIDKILVTDRILAMKNIEVSECQKHSPERYQFLQRLVTEIKYDPVKAYRNLMREIRHVDVKAKRDELQKRCHEHYLLNALIPIRNILDSCQIIQLAKPYMHEHKDRSFYGKIFHPSIRPNFMYTRYISIPPPNAELIERYKLGETDVEIYHIQGKTRKLYHIIPPEFKLSEEEYTLLDTARRYLGRHELREVELAEPQRVRENLYRIGLDMLRDITKSKGMPEAKLERLANILTRYTAGLGILELLLQDENLQDIAVNSPIGSAPVYIYHGIYQECETNIVPSAEDAESWATRFRLRSGRPLDEANPVLDTELEVPGGRARVAAITRSLSPDGLGFAFRRHRFMPWTFPLFIKNRMFDSFSAGLMWFLIDGARTMLIAGTRSSGKCLGGEELVQLSEGKLAKIKDIVETKIKTNEKGEFSSACNINLISINDRMKAVPAKCTNVWKRSTNEKMLKIRTNSGKEIVCTEDHPMFTYEGGFIEKPAKELKINDFVASPRFLKICSNTKELEIRIENFVQSNKTNSVRFKRPENLAELLEFLGFVCGDGTLSRPKIAFTNNDDAVMARFLHLADSIFGYKAKVKKTWKGVKYAQITAKNITRFVHEVFELPYGKKACSIKLPDFILSVPDEYIAKFIRSLFDCDCFIPKNHRMIEYTTASKEMAKQINLLLSRFGIISLLRIKRVKGRDYYNLVLYGNEILEFRKRIGLLDLRKRTRLEHLCTKKFTDLTTIDVIPEGGKILKKLRTKLRINPAQIRNSISKDCWAYENFSYSVTRKWFEKYIEYFEYRYKKLKNFDISLLRKFVQTDFVSINKEIKRLKKLLNVSYSELSHNISEAGIRKVLDSDNESLHLINSIEILEGKLREVQGLENFKDMADSKIETYVKLSKISGLPESSIKGYIYGGIKIPERKGEIFQSALNKLRHEYAEKIQEANKILENLKNEAEICLDNTSMLVNIGNILFDARRLLNIENEELSKKVSLQSVSNFFNNKYESSKLSTVKAISKAVIDVCDCAVNNETEMLLEQAKNLAFSDIFWDRIVGIEEMGKKERFVYDLTVDTHNNFIANGIIVHNSSFLGACMVQIMPKLRVLTVEDTLELPIEQLRSIGYNVERLKSRSVITHIETELSAEEALRTALRLGDSCLIIGEVRSREALALYEAMRIGALANVVAGTIHGESAYGVFDRVVNDLGVPPTSFKATDMILVCNSLKTPDGMRSFRRVVELTEVRKHWQKDPAEEGGFVNLLEYSAKDDRLKPTKTLLTGESIVLNDIAKRVSEWKSRWDMVWDNINLRAKIMQSLVDYSANKSHILEAPFVMESNSMFHLLSAEVREEVGMIDSSAVYERWHDWLKGRMQL